MDYQTRRDADVALLEKILHISNEPELLYGEADAFNRMLSDLKEGRQSQLSRDQYKWAIEVWNRLKPLETRKVLRGREVATPKVLLNPQEALKRKPPPRPR